MSESTDSSLTPFHLLVWTSCLALGAVHYTGSSALSGTALERFTHPPVVSVRFRVETNAMTPALSRHSRGDRVERIPLQLKAIFYRPLITQPVNLPRKV